MGDTETWLTAVKLVGGALAAVLIGLAGLVTGKRSGPATSTLEGDVVAASFTERAQLDRLIGALGCVNETLSEMLECERELVTLLSADAQRRHDEAVIREALRLRGITE